MGVRVSRRCSRPRRGRDSARSVGALDLTALGIVISFLLAGVTCVFSALAYAEPASTLPASGSAYRYAYATMGEALAWIIGWAWC